MGRPGREEKVVLPSKIVTRTIVKGMELKKSFMIIHLTIIPLTLPSFSLCCSRQLTRHDSNPALTRLPPQSQIWAKLQFDPFDGLRLLTKKGKQYQISGNTRNARRPAPGFRAAIAG